MAEFFAMGGYGLYVWGSFGMAALCLVAEVLLLNHRRARVENQRQVRRLAEGDS